METLFRDLRQALRMLANNPAFTATALLSLALGIGANSAIFSTFNSLLWRPLPATDPEQLVMVYGRTHGQVISQGFSYPEYRDYREQSTAFSGLLAYTQVAVGISSEGQDSTRAFAEAVTGNFFQVLGIKPALGRAFLPDLEGDHIGARPVVMLSHLYWQRRFASDPAIVGKIVRLNGQPFTVIGVAPAGFNGVSAIYFAPNFWIPFGAVPQLMPGNGNIFEDRTARGLRLLGRLKPGVPVASAQAEISTIAGRLAQAYPDTSRDQTVTVYPELQTRPEVEISRATNLIALIFLGLTGLVLLIACANVANLLLARSVARRREIAVRLALGARRQHLVRHLFTESVVLALFAGVLGLAVGAVTVRLLQAIRIPTDIPLNLEIRTDPHVVLFTLAIALLASIAFGVVPALQASRPDLVSALKGETPTISSGRRGLSLRNALVVTQVSVSLVLLVATGLLLRSVAGARTIDPGFRIENRLLMSFDPSVVSYDQQRATTFYRLLLERLQHTAGIQSATLASFVPLDWPVGTQNVIIEGRVAEPGQDAVQIMNSVVDPEYFRTLGTTIKSGRAFTNRDDESSPPVVLVNEVMARRYWPNQNPIGRRIRFGGPGEPFREVIGIVGDGKYRQLSEAPRPYMFLPARQNFRSARSLVIQTADPSGAIASVRREVRALDPAMPILEVKTMAEHMQRAYLGPRLSATLIGPAGLLALVIVAVGLYGVMSYSVSQRTRELGIRIAVGAKPRDILVLVMRQGLTLTGIGLLLGLAAAAAVARLIANLLFGISPADPVTFALVPLVLIGVAAVATYVPARRALQVDPLVALRAE